MNHFNTITWFISIVLAHILILVEILLQKTPLPSTYDPNAYVALISTCLYSKQAHTLKVEM